jgi:hypothetical protein
MQHADKPAGAVYPTSSTALALKPSTRFKGSSPTGDGVFPDVPITGSAVASAFHIHQISIGGIIYKISVTFMNASAHVAWAFYEPSLTEADTFLRWWSPKSRPDATMSQVADAALVEFVGGCPTVPANTANDLVIDYLTKAAAAKKAAEEEDKKVKGQVALSGGTKDTARFGVQSASLPELSDDAVNKIIAAYEKSVGKIDVKDLTLVKVAIKKQRPKAEWNKFVAKYYDGMFPT